MASPTTSHLPLDAMPRAGGTPDRREQSVVLKSFVVLMLMVAALAVFVPVWLDLIRDLAQASQSQPWGLIRGVVLGGAGMIVAIVATLIVTWARLLKLLARTDWAE